VSREVLMRAQRSLAHRGPDDRGDVVIDSDRGYSIGLAHTRLSIIDLSSAGHQPMQDPATPNWIVFNGEIYNYRELRQQLEAAGAEFVSQSDTEVMLAAYRIWGEGFLDRMRGMFAFALWDASRHRLLLARDPMGIKPLYYYQSENVFLFASEIRTFLQSGLVPRKLDSNGLLSYLAFGSVYEPWTIVDGIHAIAPGHLVTVEGVASKSREYWNPLNSARSSNDPNDHGSALKSLSETLRRAVVSHLVSDVPVGIFLSGGIDSSSLVAILSHEGVQPSTFSLVFREKEFDEGEFSRAVARRFGTNHQEIAVSEQDVLTALPYALRAMDQPTIDGINTYLVSAKARAAGVKVALSGLGADEMFAGYSNFRRVPKMEKLSAGLARVPAAARRVAASVGAIAGLSDRSRKLVEFAAGEESAIHPYFLARALFSPSERRALFAGDADASERALNDVLQEPLSRAKKLDPVNRVSYLEARCYMTNTLLRDSDFMSMAHGLELRVPFLDRDLVEASFQIEGQRKLAGDRPKSLLLDNLGVDLPDEIVKRPKRGFTLPFERWLKSEMKTMVETALAKGDTDRYSVEPEAACVVWKRFLSGETSWSRPWSLFVLHRWCEQNL